MKRHHTCIGVPRLLFLLVCCATANAQMISSLSDGRAGEVEFASITPGARAGYNPRSDIRQKAVDDTLVVLRERFAKQ